MSPPRVILRQWTDADLAPFAAMNAHPDVMRYFPTVLGVDESREALRRYQKSIAEQGWGYWAVEVDGEFAGLTGLAEPSFSAPFTPCVEIGWRFLPAFWGRGLAFAAARQAENYARSVLRLAELVSFTTAANLRSIALMSRLGFTRDLASDFLHPKIPAGHPLRPHVLYRKLLAPPALASLARVDPSSASS